MTTIIRAGRALLCALAGLLLAAVAVAAPAVASSARPGSSGTALAGDMFADWHGTAKCFSAFNGLGGVETNWNCDTGSANQRFFDEISDPCNNGGTVTQTCPFPLGSGENSRHAGEAIAHFESARIRGGCWKGQDDGSITLGDCGSTGTNWVIDGNAIINVHDTTGSQEQDMLGSATNGGNVIVANWQANFSQWAQFVGQ